MGGGHSRLRGGCCGQVATLPRLAGWGLTEFSGGTWYNSQVQWTSYLHKGTKKTRETIGKNY